jgi:hypothetical protein
MLLSRFLAVVSLAVLLSGCINSGTLVRIKPDGSGTIEQTMLVNLQVIKGLMATMGGSGRMTESGGALNEEEFKRTAQRMGVRPVSLTPLKQNGFEGGKAVFAFDDITKVRLDQDPQMPGASRGGSSGGAGSAPIRFGFSRAGGASVLTIAVDEKQAAAAAADAGVTPGAIPDTVDPAMLQMMKTMFQGFKVAIDLELEGTIVRTNADYVSGSRITLLELDIAQALDDESKLNAVASKIRPGMTISEIRPHLADVNGVKINKPSLTVEFR